MKVYKMTAAAAALLFVTALGAGTAQADELPNNAAPAAAAPAAAATPAAPAASTAAPAPAADPFTMTLPATFGAFTKQMQKSKSGDAEIETTNWVSKAPTGEAVIVTKSRMPGKILDPQKLIASTRDSLLKTLGATMEEEAPRPGDAASTRMLFKSANAFFRARFTVIDESFYQLLYVGRSVEQRSAAPVAQMFESFKIAGAPVASAAK